MSRNIGFIVEELLAKRLTDLGKEVVMQPVGHCYDLLVDGKRVDVKAAHYSLNRTMKIPAKTYVFSLQSAKRKTIKDLAASIDYFYLVFLDIPKQPVYSISPEPPFPVHSLGITDPLRCRRRNSLKLVCNLSIKEDS